MTRPTILKVLPLLTVALACGHPNRGHVCDGSASLRLGMAVLSNPGRLNPGMQVMYENGSHFLYVDGSCRYWVQTRDVWAGPRSGQLTPSEATKLEADIHYDDWIGGDWRTPSVFDASVLILYDTSVKLSCDVCESPSAPDFVKDVTAHFKDIVGPLWTSGAVLEGQGVRISVVSFDPGSYDFVPHASWPLSVPLQSIARTQGTATDNGQGIRFDGADAEKLRDLRTTYLAGPYRKQGVPGLPIDDGGQVYLLFIRDTLPFEDASGLVRPSF